MPELAALFLGVVALLLWLRLRKQSGQEGWLYFIGGRAGPIKVGITREVTPEDRLAALQTGNPQHLQVFYAVRVVDAEDAEGVCHNVLADHHVGGEWYGREAALALLREIKG